MERNRAWRRYKGEVKLRRRLKMWASYYTRWMVDSNGVKLVYPKWFDLIGTQTHFELKNHAALKYHGSHSIKYGKKGNKRRYYIKREPFTRTWEKRNFKNILEANGIKHFNITYGYASHHTESTPKLGDKEE